MLLSSEDGIRIELGILLSSGPSACFMSNKLFLFSMIMVRKAAGAGKYMLLNWFLCGYSRHLWPLCIFKITDKCSLQFSSAILSKKLLLVLVFYTLWWVCVSYMYVLLASLGKCALNQHISTKTRALFKLNQTRCQNFAGLHSFFAWRQWQTASIHGSRSNKWFISFSQLANDTKWYRMLSYTVNMKVRQKWRKVCCLTCLMNE